MGTRENTREHEGIMPREHGGNTKRKREHEETVPLTRATWARRPLVPPDPLNPIAAVLRRLLSILWMPRARLWRRRDGAATARQPSGSRRHAQYFPSPLHRRGRRGVAPRVSRALHPIRRARHRDADREAEGHAQTVDTAMRMTKACGSRVAPCVAPAKLSPALPCIVMHSTECPVTLATAGITEHFPLT